MKPRKNRPPFRARIFLGLGGQRYVTVAAVFATVRTATLRRLGLIEPNLPFVGRGLSDDERVDARAFAEALFSRDGSAPPSDRMEAFLVDLSDFAEHLTPRARALFAACLALPTFAAPPLVGARGRLRSLPIERRIEALIKLEHSPLGMGLFATKAAMSLVYYELPDAADEIGWDRRCLGARK